MGAPLTLAVWSVMVAVAAWGGWAAAKGCLPWPLLAAALLGEAVWGLMGGVAGDLAAAAALAVVGFTLEGGWGGADFLPLWPPWGCCFGSLFWSSKPSLSPSWGAACAAGCCEWGAEEAGGCGPKSKGLA